MKTTTGERLETFIYSDNSVEHLHRYSIVNDYILNKVVLDIACGEGYGSNFMSNLASHVYSVDIDENTIKLAKNKYKKDNITFKVGSVAKIPFEDNSIDIVVSFETIEHHDQHEEMLQEIKRVLKPDGVLIISTPDKYFYSDLPRYKNKFHVKELYKTEFMELIGKNFPKIQLLNQQSINGNSVIKDDENSEIVSIFSGDFNKLFTKEVTPVFLIIIASNNDFVKQKISIFDGSLIYNNFLKEQFAVFRMSYRYRIGNLLLSPFEFIKKAFK